MALRTGTEILDYYGRLKSGRGNFETLWIDYADNVRGRRDFGQEITEGRERHALLYDTTAIQASDMLASGLHNFLTNTAVEWFRVGPEDDRLLNYDECRRCYMPIVWWTWAQTRTPTPEQRRRTLCCWCLAKAFARRAA